MPTSTRGSQALTVTAFCGGSKRSSRPLSAPQEDSFERIDTRHCLQTFRPLAEHGFTLSNVLVSQLSFGNEGNIDWHTILTKPFPSSGKQLRETLQGALDNGFIRYVMDIIPNTWPSFLPEQSKLLNNR